MPQDPAVTGHDEFWRPKVVYGMATVCLLLDSPSATSCGDRNRTRRRRVRRWPIASRVTASAKMAMPSLEQMKAMADKKVDPLLVQLRTDPKNKELLLQVAYFL